MDPHVINFDEKEEKVKRSYIGSSFMGHAAASDSLEAWHGTAQTSTGWKHDRYFKYCYSIFCEKSNLLKIGSIYSYIHPVIILDFAPRC